MPTYDYECDNCSHVLEVFQSFSEAVKKKCPECGKQTLRRLISGGVGLVFKSSGFYVTDNRRAESKKPSSSISKSDSTKAKDVAHSSAAGSDKQGSKTSSTGTKTPVASSEK